MTTISQQKDPEIMPRSEPPEVVAPAHGKYVSHFLNIVNPKFKVFNRPMLIALPVFFVGVLAFGYQMHSFVAKSTLASYVAIEAACAAPGDITSGPPSEIGQLRCIFSYELAPVNKDSCQACFDNECLCTSDGGNTCGLNYKEPCDADKCWDKYDCPYLGYRCLGDDHIKRRMCRSSEETDCIGGNMEIVGVPPPPPDALDNAPTTGRRNRRRMDEHEYVNKETLGLRRPACDCKYEPDVIKGDALDIPFCHDMYFYDDGGIPTHMKGNPGLDPAHHCADIEGALCTYHGLKKVDVGAAIGQAFGFMGTIELFFTASWITLLWLVGCIRAIDGGSLKDRLKDLQKEDESA